MQSYCVEHCRLPCHTATHTRYKTEAKSQCLLIIFLKCLQRIAAVVFAIISEPVPGASAAGSCRNIPHSAPVHILWLGKHQDAITALDVCRCRYKHIHGKFVVHPVDGRKIPIITDAELVDMSFGTGAVKITPAHDPNDFMVGKRHNLEFINILDDDGNINDKGGSFKGEPRFQVRLN